MNTQQPEFVSLPTGGKMPIVGLGLWQANDPSDVGKAVDVALEAGYRHFDTATLYKNEDKLGATLKKWMEAGKVKREDLFIVTKLPPTGMAKDRLEQFIESSLRKLQLDYIDLYLMHWPLGLQYRDEDDLFPMEDGKALFDTSTNLEEIWQELERHVESGKLKAIGISNFTPIQIERIMKVAKIPISNHQIEMHVYFQNRKLKDFTEQHGIPLCAYGPLGSPGRDPKVFSGVTIPNMLQDPVIIDIATKHRRTPAQILLRFLTQQNVVVIPKSTNPQRIQQNISIFDFTLTKIDLKRIEALDKGDAGRSFPGFPGMKEHPECPWTL